MIQERKEDQIVPTEKTEKRTAFSKTYLSGPGKYRAFTSPIQIHRQDRQTGKWKEINAAFKASKQEDALESIGAQLIVSCGISGEKSFISLRDQNNHCLKWGLEKAEAEGVRFCNKGYMEEKRAGETEGQNTKKLDEP